MYKLVMRNDGGGSACVCACVCVLGWGWGSVLWYRYCTNRVIDDITASSNKVTYISHDVMMASWHGNVFCITDPLWGESNGPPVDSPLQRVSHLLEQAVEQAVELPTLMLRHFSGHVFCSTARPVPHREPFWLPLQWRHNECDVVANYRRPGCYLRCLVRHRSKKTTKLRVTGLCGGIQRWPMDSPHKGAVMRKMFPFYDVIMVRLALTVPCATHFVFQTHCQQWR